RARAEVEGARGLREVVRQAQADAAAVEERLEERQLGVHVVERRLLELTARDEARALPRPRALAVDLEVLDARGRDLVRDRDLDVGVAGRDGPVLLDGQRDGLAQADGSSGRRRLSVRRQGP